MILPDGTKVWVTAKGGRHLGIIRDYHAREDIYAVEIMTPNYDGHSCANVIKNKHGRWCYETSMKVISPFHEEVASYIMRELQ